MLTYPKPAVLRAVAENSKIGLDLLGHFAGKLQALRSHAALFGIKSSRERVLAWLQLQPHADNIVHVERPWKQIAGELGLTHEAVYRALAGLERDGMIVRDRAAGQIAMAGQRR